MGKVPLYCKWPTLLSSDRDRANACCWSESVRQVADKQHHLSGRAALWPGNRPWVDRYKGTSLIRKSLPP